MDLTDKNRPPWVPSFLSHDCPGNQAHLEKTIEGDLFGIPGILDFSTFKALAKSSFTEKTSDPWSSGSGDTRQIQKLDTIY